MTDDISVKIFLLSHFHLNESITPNYLLNTICNGNTELKAQYVSILNTMVGPDYIDASHSNNSTTYRRNAKTGLYLELLKMERKANSWNKTFVNIQSGLLVLTGAATIITAIFLYHQNTLAEASLRIQSQTQLQDSLQQVAIDNLQHTFSRFSMRLDSIEAKQLSLRLYS